MFGVDSYTTDYVDSYGYGSNTGGGKGQIENYGWTNATYNSLLTINYDWNINEDWGLNVVAGNEVIQSNRGKYYEYGTGYNFRDGIISTMQRLSPLHPNTGGRKKLSDSSETYPLLIKTCFI